MLTQPNLKHTFLFPTKPIHLISLVKPSTIPQRDFDRTRQTAALRLNRILIRLWFWQLGLIVHIDRSP